MKIIAIVSSIVLGSALTASAAAQQVVTRPPLPTEEARLSDAVLERMGLRPTPCPSKDVFRFEGQFWHKLRASVSGGAFFAPRDRYLRIDRVATSMRGSVQTAGEVEATVRRLKVRRELSRLSPRSPFWAWPPAIGQSLPLYADKGTSVYVRSTRTGDLGKDAASAYIVTGCLVDQLPVMLQPPARTPQ